MIMSEDCLFVKQDCYIFLDKIPDESIDLIIIDPPYNTTNADFEVVLDLKTLFEKLDRISKKDCAIICFCQLPFTYDVITAYRSRLKYSLVWDKRFGANFFQANIMPMKTHEDILVFCKTKTKFNPQKLKRKTPLKIDFKPQKNKSYMTVYGHTNEKIKSINKDFGYFEYSNPTTILSFDRKKDKNNISPTQKPVDLIRYLIRQYSNKNDIVLDCFSGSGTTAVAAFMEGRKFKGCEIHDRYFNKAEKRIKDTISQFHINF